MVATAIQQGDQKIAGDFKIHILFPLIALIHCAIFIQSRRCRFNQDEEN
ncbi:MAG: hypothetical protein ACXWJK_11500 [Burkholderiaceae bacterium]